MSQTIKPQLSTNSDSANTYSEAYFDALYDNNKDPWAYQTRWYEKRKRELCMAVLPKANYANAIELGCGNGVMSSLLAKRCQSLISIDGNSQAVALAKQRLQPFNNAYVLQGVIPSDLISIKQKLECFEPITTSKPRATSFDLIVISEILYYLSTTAIDEVINWIKQNLTADGTLLCCHWRYDIKEFELTGDTVHHRLQSAFNSNHCADKSAILYTHQSQIIDRDFLLDVWQKSPQTIAMAENLV